ncbi:MAG: SpoIID/LytB domain-containing protein [Anaerolineae bacterium]
MKPDEASTFDERPVTVAGDVPVGAVWARTTLHCQRIPDWVAEALAALRSRWVKLVNPPAGTDPFPSVRKCVRLWTDDWDGQCIARGAAGAEQYMARMLPLWAPYRAWADGVHGHSGVAFELPNEPACNGDEELATLDAFTRRCLAIGSVEGLQLVALNLPEGNPHDSGTGAESVTRGKVQRLTGCVAAAVEGGHLVGLHGYWRPGVEVPGGRYHALRCVDMVRWWGEAGVEVQGGPGRLPLQVALTEWGVDGGIAGNPAGHGWRDLMGQADYVAQVVEGERALRDLAFVEFAALFTAGPEVPWGSYEQDEETVARIAQGIGVLGETDRRDAVDRVDKLRVWRRDTDGVEAMAVEQYLRGVVPAEMPAAWPGEALRAQAVAARTYALAAIVTPRHPSRAADLCDRTCCQVWRPATDGRSDAAVSETAGETWGADGNETVVSSGSYVAECGRDDCPYCQGRPGTNGEVFATRLCQNGARMLAERGYTYHDILAHYYGDAGDARREQEESGMAEAATLKAYAWDGQETTVESLQRQYRFRVRRAEAQQGESVYRLVALRERAGTTAVAARVLGSDGLPQADQAVAGYWPDAPAAAVPLPWDWYSRYVTGRTGAGGEATALVMGPGGTIGAEGGPHAVWVASAHAKSDCLDGIGWDGASDHRHVEGEWRLLAECAGDSPAGETGVDITALRWQAEEAVREIEGVQAALEQARQRLLRGVIAPAYALEGARGP